MRRARLAVAALALAGLVAGTTASADAQSNSNDRATQQAKVRRATPQELRRIRENYKPGSLRRRGEVTAIVQFKGATLVELEVAAKARGRVFNASAASSKLRAERDANARRLSAAGARVTGTYERVLNGVKVRVDASKIDKLRSLPGVKSVSVSYVVKPSNANANEFTGVPAAWDDLGVYGEGMKIGIIDSGIDYFHKDFDGAGKAAFDANDPTTIADGGFPTVKVAGGYDFAGDDYDPDLGIPATPDEDPVDCDGHGTHVAGTAAGQGVNLDGTTYTGPYTTGIGPFKVHPGSAPLATLYAYKVFGCFGGAENDVIIDAIEMGVADGVDVLNMSLGSTWGSGNDADEAAVNAAALAGVVMVIAAGNEGASPYQVGGPSTATRALSVAAVDGGVPTVAAAESSLNSNVLQLSNDVPVPGVGITGEILRLGLGCDEADYDGTNPPGAAGKIVVADRGDCDRVDRAIFGAAHGALAVILVNSAPGFPPFEGPIPGVNIPFLGADGLDAADFPNGATTTLSDIPPIPNPSYGSTASFSSNGPRNSDSAQKPELSAPGVSMFSAGVGTGDEAAASSGTSMATPHVAGIAALVNEAHPDWTTNQIKAALQSTGDPGGVIDFDSRRNGSGLVDPREAIDTVAYIHTPDHLNTVNFNFNAINSQHQEGAKFQITNLGATDITYALTVDVNTPPWATISVPPTVKVKAGKTVTVTAKLTVSPTKMAALPSAYFSDFGDLVSFNGTISATPTVPGPGVYTLTTPFMFVPKGLSDIDPMQSSVKVKSGSTTLKLRNKGKHDGYADVYAHAGTDSINDVPLGSSIPNIAQVGVQNIDYLGDPVVSFAVNLNTGRPTHALEYIYIEVDTDGDDIPDIGIDTFDAGLSDTGVPAGYLASVTYTLDTETITDAWFVTAPHNGSFVNPWTSADVGLGIDGPGEGEFTFRVYAYSLLVDGEDVGPPAATFHAWDEVLKTGDFEYLAPGASVSIPVAVDVSELANQTPRGWLVVSVDDLHGPKTAQVISISGTPT